MSATFSSLLLAVFAGPTNSTAARPADGVRVLRDRDLGIRLVTSGQVVTFSGGNIRRLECNRLRAGEDDRFVAKWRRFVFRLVGGVFRIHPADVSGKDTQETTGKNCVLIRWCPSVVEQDTEKLNIIDLWAVWVFGSRTAHCGMLEVRARLTGEYLKSSPLASSS